jgi:hypothetical protein
MARRAGLRRAVCAAGQETAGEGTANRDRGSLEELEAG